MNGFVGRVTRRERARRGVVEDAWQRFSPVPPARANTVTVVPAGEVSVPVRSPTNVWSMPTVVDAGVSVQVVPSTANVIFDA